jgi:hypothetical protein
MAIAIPFVASALGATALQATLISVAFSVTGISAKIDKAATKVFGKDLVMLGNVLGAGYAMFNGGFDIGGTADAAAMNVPTGAEAGDLFQGQMAAQGISPTSVNTDAFNLSDMTGGGASGDAALDDFGYGGGEDLSTAASGESVNMLTDKVGITDGKAATTTAPADDALKLTSSTSQPQGTGAASAQATAGNATAAQATDQIVPNATQAKAAADVLSKQLAPYQQPSNIFERLMYTTDKAGNRVFNDRLAGGVIQGLGSAASGYMQSQEAAKGLDWQKQKYGARIGGRVTG